MDIAYNKTDGVVLPITNTRISASEYNQIAASLMQIITSAGLTPDAANNVQLLNALKAMGSGWPMPSSTYVDLTLGASGSTYTMPGNGWLYIDKTAGINNAYVVFKSNDLSITGEFSIVVPVTGNHCTLLMPVTSGAVVTVNYSATGTTNYFRFIYPNGGN